MARGNSRAQSERPGSEDFKKAVAKGASGQGGKIDQLAGDKADLIEHFKDLAKSDIQPELKGLKKSELAEAADYVIEATQEAADRQKDHDDAVVRSKEVLKGEGTYPFEDFRQVAKFLPLTADEMDQAEENGQDNEEYAYDLLQANFEDDVMSDMRGNYERTNTDDYDTNQSNDESNRAAFARSLLEDRVASAEKDLDAHLDNLNTIRQNALERWIDLRGKGSI
jgi:hypothetical protein